MNNPNPYQPPPPEYQQPPYQQQGPYGPASYVAVPAMSRTPFVLAGVGALATSAYWGLLTLFIGFSVATGGSSFLQVVLPLFLIVLYAMRGIQLFKGNVAAARPLLGLHIVGAIVGVINLMSPSSIVVVLYGVKIVIHVFGAITAYLAMEAYKKNVNANAYRY